jgi:hypothetical protein
MVTLKIAETLRSDCRLVGRILDTFGHGSKTEAFDEAQEIM